MSEPRREPERDLTPGMQEQLGFGHAGVATFAQRPWLSEPDQLDAWQPDVAIVGAPFDISTTNRGALRSTRPPR
jgi:agmatinase